MNEIFCDWSFEDNPTSYDYIRLWARNKTYHIGYINKQHNELDVPIAHLIAAAPDLLEALQWQEAFESGREWVIYVNHENLAALDRGDPKPYDYGAVLKRHCWLRDAARKMRHAAIAKVTEETGQ